MAVRLARLTDQKMADCLALLKVEQMALMWAAALVAQMDVRWAAWSALNLVEQKAYTWDYC